MAHNETDTCEDCLTTLEKVKGILSSLPSLQHLHIDIKTINQSAASVKGNEKSLKKKSRSRIQRLLREKVSALRNSLGGHLLIHLHGLQKNDRYVGAFDELVDDDLTWIIEDNLYINVYYKVWLDEVTQNQRDKAFLVLAVEPSQTVCIAQTFTKQPLEFSVKDVFSQNLVSMKRELIENQSEKESPAEEPEKSDVKVESKKRTPAKEPENNNVKVDLSKLQEGYNVQVKSVERCPLPSDNTERAKYIWTELRLREYISAFTKIKPRTTFGGRHGGGSYFLGIGEKAVNRQLYGSKELDIQGLQLNIKQREDLKYTLLEQNDTLLVCDVNGDKLLSERVFTVLYHPWKDRFVLEVRVKHVEGFVFYDPEGPCAYRIEDNEIVKIPVKKILQLIPLKTQQ